MSVINLCSPSFEAAESYGRIALELDKTFTALGADVNPIGGYTPAHDGRRIKLATGGILLGYPTLWELYTPLVHHGPRLAVTMFESTILPKGWVERLNKAAGVVVPAQFLVDIFRDNGITVPMRVTPLGISETFFQPKRREMSQPFTFLAIADRGWRKGWWHTTRAFVNAFGQDMNYRLILKVRNAPELQISNPNIEVVSEEMDDAGLVELYQRCHVMVAATCAEGFGFLPREFAATGGLALATNWGGTADAIEHWGVPIPYALEPAWCDDPGWKGKLGLWAEPDIEGLSHLMRHVAGEFSAYQDFAMRAAGYVSSHYRWSLMGRQVYGFWNELLEAQYGSNDSRENTLPA